MSIAGPDATYAIGLAPEKAIAFLEGKEARVTGSWRDWLDGEHARAFTVANVAKLDVLQDIQTSLVDALKKGQTVQQWKDGLVPQLQAKGWWKRDGTTEQLRAAGRVDEATGEIAKGLTPRRLQTIFQTNMQSAYMAGRYEEMVNEAHERPFWEYVAILDSRTRPAHRAMNGRIFRYDDPGWGSFYPPCGYRCRCRVRNFSETEITRRKLSVSSTDGHLQAVQVPLRGGGSATVTRYVDPALPGGRFQPDVGFSNNPALTAWQPRLEPMDTALSRRYVETAVQGPAFGRFIEKQQDGFFPVAALRQQERERLQVDAPAVYLPGDAVKRMAARNDAPSLDDYRRIPEIVDEGEAYPQAGNRLVFLFEEGSALRLALKPGDAGEQLTVLGLTRTTADKARAEIRARLQK